MSRWGKHSCSLKNIQKSFKSQYDFPLKECFSFLFYFLSSLCLSQDLVFFARGPKAASRAAICDKGRQGETVGTQGLRSPASVDRSVPLDTWLFASRNQVSLHLGTSSLPTVHLGGFLTQSHGCFSSTTVAKGVCSPSWERVRKQAEEALESLTGTPSHSSSDPCLDLGEMSPFFTSAGTCAKWR